MSPAHLAVFQYPPPDGVRPIDLADRTFMSKQALNQLLRQLEAHGYIERRLEKANGRRLIFLTRRGWRVCETQWSVMQDLEREMSASLGPKAFGEFMNALRELASLDAKSPRLPE